MYVTWYDFERLLLLRANWCFKLAWQQGPAALQLYLWTCFWVQALKLCV